MKPINMAGCSPRMFWSIVRLFPGLPLEVSTYYSPVYHSRLVLFPGLPLEVSTYYRTSSSAVSTVSAINLKPYCYTLYPIAYNLQLTAYAVFLTPLFLIPHTTYSILLYSCTIPIPTPTPILILIPTPILILIPTPTLTPFLIPNPYP